MANRTERLEIRLTPQEKADLREQADTEDMTITELVVYKCLHIVGYLEPLDVEVAQIECELRDMDSDGA